MIDYHSIYDCVPSWEIGQYAISEPILELETQTRVAVIYIADPFLNEGANGI